MVLLSGGGRVRTMRTTCLLYLNDYMARKVFYSFHYKPDNWRVSQVRNIGSIDKSAVATDHDWEQIEQGGDPAIQKWIDGQLYGRSCTVVLIGAATAGRKWIEYEIKKSWDDGKGLVGVYIHNLKDRNGQQSMKGANPFSRFTLKQGTVQLDSVVSVYDPPYYASTDVYAYISENLEVWIDQAVAKRKAYV